MIQDFADKLTTEIKDAMKDVSKMKGDEASKLYFNTFVKIINEYLNAHHFLNGAFIGTIPGTPTVITLTAEFKINFNLIGDPIRSAVNAAAQSVITTGKANTAIPNIFANSTYLQLIQQQVNSVDTTMMLVSLTQPVFLISAFPIQFNFGFMEKPEDVNLEFAKGIFNALNGMTIAPAAAVATATAAVGTFTFAPLVIT